VQLQVQLQVQVQVQVQLQLQVPKRRRQFHPSSDFPSSTWASALAVDYCTGSFHPCCDLPPSTWPLTQENCKIPTGSSWRLPRARHLRDIVHAAWLPRRES
jgi:hypothetical protein